MNTIRTLILLMCCSILAGAATPNIVIVLADDLGYGDLGIYGHPTIQTPHLDRMAMEGQKWTNFYVGASVCTPSRAALMTGRLPIRNGMMSAKSRVLFPDSHGGLQPEEITIAEVLKAAGYATGAIGKWHLGHRPQYLPTKQGFDSYYGVPYSNDMDKTPDAPTERWALFRNPRAEHFHVPLMRNEEIIERPVDQDNLTKRYALEAVEFIRRNKDRPFFLYLAHNLPHVPLFRSKEFAGVSLRGLYGDVVEEVDWSVGQIFDALRREGLASNTLVLFTSDNGPWLSFDDHGGSAGLLREGKGSTWEGGMREPAVFWWPGKIAAVVQDMGSTLDLLPTLARIAGQAAPADRTLDGYDISPVLFGTGPSPRREMFYWREERLFAARVGDYKAHFTTRGGYGPDKEVQHDPPLLFHLGVDPGESWNIAAQHPDIVDRIRRRANEHRASIRPVKNQLEERSPAALSDQTARAPEGRR